MEKSPTPFSKPLAPDFGTKFEDMTPAGKWVFVAKVIVCVCAFGFAFPNVQSD